MPEIAKKSSDELFLKGLEIGKSVQL
jgi:hypothetical protein